MAEKLNRDRSIRKQTRASSESQDQKQNSSRLHFSSDLRSYTDINESKLRKRDSFKSAINYPPLEDYAE